jgi:hypothetical protein
MASGFIKIINGIIKPTAMKSVEEIQVKKKMWRKYSDAELNESDQKFSIGRPYDNMAPYSRWSVRGLSNDEILSWLRQVKQHAPEFMYRGLLAVTEKEVNNNRWEQIRNSLVQEFRYV